MARTASAVYNRRRVNFRSGRVQTRTREDGNAVRQEVVYAPQRKKVRTVSRQVARNRARARSIDAAFVFFLAVACISTMFICVHFLQLRSQVTTQTEKIASLERQLSQLAADNDAYISQVKSTESMEQIRSAALDHLGLHSATEDQIRYYNADDESYVRQYAEVADGK